MHSVLYYFLFRLLDIIVSRGLNQQLYLVEFSDGHQTPDRKHADKSIRICYHKGAFFFLRGCPAKLIRLPSGRVNGSKNGNAANLSETAKFPMFGMVDGNAGISNASLHGEANRNRMHLGRLNQSPGRRNVAWSGTNVTAVKRELSQGVPGEEEHVRKLINNLIPHQSDNRNKKHN